MQEVNHLVNSPYIDLPFFHPFPCRPHSTQFSPLSLFQSASAYFLYGHACICARIRQAEYLGIELLLMLSENFNDQRADICQCKAIYSIYSSNQASNVLFIDRAITLLLPKKRHRTVCAHLMSRWDQRRSIPWKYPIDRAKVTTTSVQEGV